MALLFALFDVIRVHSTTYSPFTFKDLIFRGGEGEGSVNENTTYIPFTFVDTIFQGAGKGEHMKTRADAVCHSGPMQKF